MHTHSIGNFISTQPELNEKNLCPQVGNVTALPLLRHAPYLGKQRRSREPWAMVRPFQ